MSQTITQTAAALEKTMTVAQLIAFLSDLPQDMPVLIPQAKTDYWGRAPLMGLTDHRSEELPVHYSEYHRALIPTPDGGDDEAEADDAQEIVALILG